MFINMLFKEIINIFISIAEQLPRREFDCEGAMQMARARRAGCEGSGVLRDAPPAGGGKVRNVLNTARAGLRIEGGIADGGQLVQPLAHQGARALRIVLSPPL